MYIIDDILEPHDYIRIKDLMMSHQFPWYLYNTVVESTKEEIEDKEIYHFIHLFFYDGLSSNVYDILNPILNKLNAKTIIKIKANLLTCTKDPKFFSMHVDTAYPTAKTAIFYVNTNDGVTKFETGEEIASVANRLVVFDNNISHTGRRPTDQTSRVLINFNYFDY